MYAVVFTLHFDFLAILHCSKCHGRNDGNLKRVVSQTFCVESGTSPTRTGQYIHTRLKLIGTFLIYTRGYCKVHYVATKMTTN